MLRTMLFLTLLSLEPVFIHISVFKELEPFDFSNFFVFFQFFLLSSILLTFGKKTIAAVFVLESLIFMLLLTWHRYFSDPLSLATVVHQYREGLVFAQKSKSSFLSLDNFLILAGLAVKLVILYRVKVRMPYPKLVRFAFPIPFIIIGVLIGGYNRQHIYGRENLNEYAKNMGYLTAWMYELSSGANGLQWLAKVAEDSNSPSKPLPEELKDMSLPGNIFLVQVESLDYAAVFGEVDKRKIMPFLNGLSEDSVVYRTPPHGKKASANTDFCLATRGSFYEETETIMYEVVPPKVYEKITPLPVLMREKGYRTGFYHGFSEAFYKRREPMERMGFEEVWFVENLPIRAPQGEWGFDDLDLFKFALENNGKDGAEKHFNFIITVSSHESFDIGKRHDRIYKNPKEMRERYVNAMNYVDGAFKELVENAPEDSLFVIFSDHTSLQMEDESTILMVHDKRTAQKFHGEATIRRAYEIIKGIWEL